MNATETTVAQPTRTTLAELIATVAALTLRVDALEVKPTAPVGIEMTDAMAESVTYGELAALKHKDAAEKLGLTYGQVYSARLEFTFKAVHKAAKDANKKNAWVK